MKRRIIPILKITIVLVLFSSLAYALEKKKQTKPVDFLPDTIHEEEALQAELLAATEEHQNNKPEIDDNLKKHDGGESDVMKDQQKIKINPQSHL